MKSEGSRLKSSTSFWRSDMATEPSSILWR